MGKFSNSQKKNNLEYILHVKNLRCLYRKYKSSMSNSNTSKFKESNKVFVMIFRV